ncbi:MAG: hypothetical protein ABI847_16735, partial [Anaerolineales bacterium]
MLRFELARRAAWLAAATLLGLGSALLLLAILPARPAQAAAAPPTPPICTNDNDLEPNNTYTDAAGLVLPAVLYNRWICNDTSPQDFDWYSMTLAGGQRVVIFA